MRLHTFPNEFVVEPDSEALSSGIVAGIRFNRETGAITRFNPLENPVDRTQAHSQFIYGILGIPKLLRGRYLCVITNSELVAKLQGHEIRRVTNTMLIPYSNAQLVQDLRSGPHRADEAEYLQLFSSVLDTLSFYFSYTYDVTHSTQRIQALRENPEVWHQPLWRRADERFFFNRYLVSDLIDQHMDEYVLPVVSGYVCAQSSSIKSQNFSFVIFSRRGCRRAGRRYTTRGCDIQGNAANFAETEQILFAPDQTDATKSRVFSFVQTRGSIPVLWKQTVTMKYMPTIDIVGEGQSSLALRRHFDDLKQHYGRQIVVNLVNQTGKEGKLEQFFKQTVEQNGDSDVRYVAFDFHKECKNMKYENLSKLVSTVNDEFDRMGYFFAEISTPLTAAGTPSDPQVKVYSTQKAAFRTNCMDSLDRTNVVQSVLARRVLNTQFQQLNITATEDPARGFASAQFEHIFKNVWANNADSMAVQYTGTGALKTDYTRTGKRTPAGGFADFTNSAKRYVLNNFYDGYVQDGLDLFLGNYVPDPSKPSPLQPKPGAKSPSLFKFLMQVGLVLMAAFLLWGLFGPWFGIPTPTGRLRVFLYLVLYPLVAFKACEKKGKKFVVHPRLKPEFEQDPGKLKAA